MVNTEDTGPSGLELRDVKKRLGDRAVLAGVTLQARAGDVIVVLGQNGSGKSTLLRLVAGILEPSSGQILINGVDLSRGAIAPRRAMGYVPDNSDPLPDLRVSEFIDLVRALKRAPAPSSDLVALLGVAPYLSQRLGTLSFGQRKRAALLAALVGDPRLLILDEPTNGLDPDGARMVIDLIDRLRGAGSPSGSPVLTLLSTNDAPFAQALRGRAFRLNEGRLTTAA